jgi:hypothetical protein
MKKLLLLGVLGLAGCVSVEDIRSYEPRARHEVGEDFAELANCLADAELRQNSALAVTPIISQRQRRATITATAPAYTGMSVAWETEVVAVGPGRSVVSFRDRKTAFNQQARVEDFHKRLADCVPGWAPAG